MDTKKDTGGSAAGRMRRRERLEGALSTKAAGQVSWGMVLLLAGCIYAVVELVLSVTYFF